MELNISLRKIGVSFIIVLVTAIIQWLIYPIISPAPFLLFYPAIIVSTIYGHGILVVLCFMLISQYIFVPPYMSFAINWPNDILRQLIFFISGLMVCIVTRRLHETIARQKILSKDLMLKSEALENSLNGFDIVSDQGLFLYVNSAYVKMWGYDSASEIIGTSPATHCADPETPMKIITTLKEQGKCDLEFLAKKKDGSTFHVRMLAQVAHDAEGREVYPTTSIDITERKEAELAMLKSEEALKQAIRLRDEFISVASHELKTPLTTLILQTQLRQRYVEKNNANALSLPKLEMMLAIDLKQLTRINQLIEDMLDISRIQTGRLKLNLETIDLCQLTQAIVEMTRPIFQNVTIDLNLETESAMISGDSFRLEQVLNNLLSNAHKYGDGKTITVVVGKTQSRAYVKIIDQGRGIDPKDQKRIFNRFERAVSINEVSGLGLGLAIARDMVEAHGGEISVESQPGKGSVFTFELPLIHHKI